MQTSIECMRCKEPMERGFIIDRGDYSLVDRQEWFPGRPTKSFWTGLKVKGLKSHKVHAFRCTRCGYLESYAS